MSDMVTILLVEERDGLGLVQARRLQRMGYNVLHAPPREALAVLAAHANISIVLVNGSALSRDLGEAVLTGKHGGTESSSQTYGEQGRTGHFDLRARMRPNEE